MASPIETAWARGRLGLRAGSPRLLFGRMYEDAQIELSAFRPGGRIFCIASAGCTAMALSVRHDVVAVDVNPVQVAYARSRFEGAAAHRGSADRLMGAARALAVLAGWSRGRIRDFLDLSDPAEQLDYWRRRLDGFRLRAGLDLLLSRVFLGAVYAAPFLRVLPPRFGRVMRARLERCFATHPNRNNPYARALLLGELAEEASPPEARSIELILGDAASFLENAPEASFDGFTLSNVLDGARAEYRARLLAAVRRAAAPGASMILRSFADPRPGSPRDRAAEDRSILWGTVEVRPVETL